MPNSTLLIWWNASNVKWILIRKLPPGTLVVLNAQKEQILMVKWDQLSVVCILLLRLILIKLTRSWFLSGATPT